MTLEEVFDRRKELWFNAMSKCETVVLDRGVRNPECREMKAAFSELADATKAVFAIKNLIAEEDPNPAYRKMSENDE